MSTQQIINGWENGIEPYQLSKWWQTKSCQDALERANKAKAERIARLKESVTAKREQQKREIETWEVQN